jgi:hypothetical protein
MKGAPKSTPYEYTFFCLCCDACLRVCRVSTVTACFHYSYLQIACERKCTHCMVRLQWHLCQSMYVVYYVYLQLVTR